MVGGGSLRVWAPPVHPAATAARTATAIAASAPYLPDPDLPFELEDRTGSAPDHRVPPTQLPFARLGKGREPQSW